VAEVDDGIIDYKIRNDDSGVEIQKRIEADGYAGRVGVEPEFDVVKSPEVPTSQ